MSKKTDANKRSNEVATAIHVIKGAMAKVLGANVTASTTFESKTRGRVCVEYANADSPKEDVLAQIQEHVTKKIRDNVPVVIDELDRKEAEEKYRKDNVNGQFIYEKRQPPASITRLNILEIPDWTVCCVPVTDFCKKTGEIGGVKLLKFNHRPQKSELEIVFDVTEAAPADGSSPSGTAVVAPAKQVFTLPKSNADNVELIANELLDSFFAAFPKQLDSVDVAQTRAQLLASTKIKLTQLKNAAYATGMAAKLSK